MLEEVTSPFEDDAVIDGRYRIMRRLSDGGMGTVFLARQINLDREVALKVIRKDVSMVAELRQRFVREATALARVSHDHIVTIHDHGQLPTGELYIVMEYLEGFHLQNVVDMEGPLPFERVLRLGLEIARALRMAHSVDVLHRDLKPANIMVIPSLDSEHPERVKLLDFGLAKLLDSPNGDANITMSPSLLGTPYYMSPEQICGDVVGPATDIYALGCVLYYMTAGVPVFEADRQAEIVVGHLNHMPAPTSLVGYQRWCPPKLEVLLFRCLQKDPDDRYPSMQAVIDALKEVLESLGQLQPRDHSHLEPVDDEADLADSDPTLTNEDLWSDKPVFAPSPVPDSAPREHLPLPTLPPMPPPDFAAPRPAQPVLRARAASEPLPPGPAAPVLPASEPAPAADAWVPMPHLARAENDGTAPPTAPMLGMPAPIPAARLIRRTSGELSRGDTALEPPPSLVRPLALDPPPRAARTWHPALVVVLLVGPLLAWLLLRVPDGAGNGVEVVSAPAARAAEVTAPADEPAARIESAQVPTPSPDSPVAAAVAPAADTPTPSPEAQEVVVAIVSRPAGAKVYDGGVLLGTTPLQHTFAVRSAGELRELTFERDGYASAVVRAAIDAETPNINGVLEPLAAATPRARPRASAGAERVARPMPPTSPPPTVTARPAPGDGATLPEPAVPLLDDSDDVSVD